MSSSRPVPRVYLFYGDDHASRAAYIARLRARLAEAGGEAWATLNYQRLSPATHSLDDLRAAVLSVPLFVRRRLIHAVEPLGWAKDARQRQRFLAVLDEVPASTALVLDIGQRLDEGRRGQPPHWLLAWAQRRGPEYVFLKALPAPRDVAEMARWLYKAAHEAGAQLTPEAAQALAAAIGPDTLRGLNEVRKLALYAGERPITADDVAALVEGEWAPDLFRWLDLVGAGQSQAAWRYLARLREIHDAAFVWNMLLRHFRLLLVLRDASDQGANLKAVAREWGIPAFALPRYRQQMARFSRPALQALYRRLYRLESRFRRHEITLDDALEDLLTYLTLHARGAS
ncbi:MAG: DNA polymerase III subunit delta [Chloroflexi bacterium]|nr:DNA polymerase III subunit delta [Chloroflexota bacterium]